MCGICGINNNDEKIYVNENEIINMCNMLAHRGPDDSGMFLDKNIGMGHRRLSIIDISGGHQPLSNEDKSLWVVYNGEIYNYKFLKAEMEKKGHKFQTSCDTEILIHLYEEYGENFLDKIQGMYSFVIWDTKKKRMFGARDRLGIKPFYYFSSQSKFIFASEIKALLQCDGISYDMDEDVLPEYLIFRFVSGEKTFFKNIKSLLPGHAFILEKGKLTVWKHWDIREKYKYNHILSKKKALEYIDNLLDASVRKRLMSDVPLGTLNSGGIDSSLVTAYAAEMQQDPINTYSVGFFEKDYDESCYANIVSNKFNTTHHTLKVGHEEYAKNLPLSLWYNDEPLNHANSVLISLICKLARQKVTVLLTGEGADEVFGGYPRIWLLLMNQCVPYSFRKVIARSLSVFNSHYINKVREFLPLRDHETVLFNASFVTPGTIDMIMSRNIDNENINYRSSLINSLGSDRSLVDKGLILDLHTYLVSILHRMDKMSMAAGVEARVPFLDHELVEFAVSLPFNYKLGLATFQNKVLLKKLALKRLPKEIIYRKKSGFGVPIHTWFKEERGLKPFLTLFMNGEIMKRDIFQKDRIDMMIKQHLSGLHDNSELLWQLINLEIWYNLFINKKSVENDARQFADEILH